MLYERTAISKRPEKTIRNDIQLLEEKDVMTVDMGEVTVWVDKRS